MKREVVKIFIDEKYSSPPRENYETNKIVYNHFDEIWSIDLSDFSDFKHEILENLDICLL